LDIFEDAIEQERKKVENMQKVCKTPSMEDKTAHKPAKNTHLQ